MSKKPGRARAAIVPLILIAFLSFGCGGLELSLFGEDEASQASRAVEEAYSTKPKPRDPRLAEGEIYRVHLTFGEAMSDGGWYSVEIQNPRNNWRDLVRWDCLTDITEFEEDYRFYDFPFMSDNFNTQDPALMDGEYTLTIANSLGLENQMSPLNWSDGQFVDGGYAEYAVP